MRFSNFAVNENFKAIKNGYMYISVNIINGALVKFTHFSAEALTPLSIRQEILLDVVMNLSFIFVVLPKGSRTNVHYRGPTHGIIRSDHYKCMVYWNLNYRFVVRS